MKKIILLLICLFSLTGCGNKYYDEIEKVVLTNTVETIKNNVKEINDKLIMFPDKENEDKLITYLIVINDYKDRFTNIELDDITNTIDTNYKFELNSLGYNKDKVNNLISEIKK